MELYAVIKDCPPNGIEAVDWRIQHGLEPAPTASIDELRDVEFQSEETCRLFKEHLDANADLILDGRDGRPVAIQVPFEIAREAKCIVEGRGRSVQAFLRWYFFNVALP
jgi:hypothetical protein